MDLKTQKRIKSYQAKQRADRAQHRPQLTPAQRAHRKKLRDAKARKPGFGCSTPSVADHLNEVVGLTEHKITAKERRDKRIDAAAKSGLGCRRFLAAADPSLIPTKGWSGKSSSAGKSNSSYCREKPFRVACGEGHKLGSNTPSSTSTSKGATRMSNQTPDDRQKQLDSMRMARQAYFARLEQENQTCAS